MTKKINENKSKKIGAFVGKFLPPHIGHIHIIDKVISECDEVVIVISENKIKSKALCEKASFPYFSAKKRLKWFKNHYKLQKNVKYRIIDECKLKSKEFSGEEYAKLFHKSVKEKVNIKYADESYRELNEKYFKECEFRVIDRNEVPVHSTAIRENKDNLKFAIEECHKDILKALKK